MQTTLTRLAARLAALAARLPRRSLRGRRVSFHSGLLAGWRDVLVCEDEGADLVCEVSLLGERKRVRVLRAHASL